MRLEMSLQPDDQTCGPTSLHSIYRYYDDDITLEEVINTVKYTKSGGTIDAYLGQHALQRNYKVSLYVHNLVIFDPSWFVPRKLSNNKLIKKLKQQMEVKTSKRLRESSQAYIDYLELGGNILYHELTVSMLKKFFARKIPILTGLSATNLYQSKREIDVEDKSVYDDINGSPTGHFVVLCGYNENKRHIIVADPHRKNPISRDIFYNVSISRLINSIMLGVLTHDGNLLAIQR